AVASALMQEHLLEFEIIARRAVKAAAAHVEFGFLRQLERDFLQRPVGLARMHAGEPPAPGSVELEGGIAHAARRKNVVAEIDLEIPAADLLDRLADPIDVDAVVPFLAGLEQQRRGERLVEAAD